jgi:hypothetical protein
VDVEAKVVTVSRLEGAHWLELAVHGGDEIMHAEPFDELAIPLADLWSVD